MNSPPIASSVPWIVNLKLVDARRLASLASIISHAPIVMPDESGGDCPLRVPAIPGLCQRLSLDVWQEFRNTMTQRQIARGPDIDPA